MAVTEQPLIFTNGDESKWFRFEAAPPATAEGWWNYPLYGSNVAFGRPTVKWDGGEIGGGWQGAGGTNWKEESRLPPGHEGRWLWGNAGSITTVVTQIGSIPENAQFEFTAYVYVPRGLRTILQLDADYGNGSSESYTVRVGPTVGDKNTLSSWQPVSIIVTTWKVAAELTVTISGLPKDAELIAPRLRNLDNEHRPWAFCASAKDGHLSGLWSLPDMLGEIKSNVLFGGGIAPANPQYGPRPITYVIYVAGSSRSATMETIREFLGFIAEGNISSNNNGYGWTGRGWAAAPPDVEWLANTTQIAKLSFTVTYLSPYLMPTNTWAENWAGKYFEPEELWEFGSPDIYTSGWMNGAGQITITNPTNTTVWPIFAIKNMGRGTATMDIRPDDSAVVMSRFVELNPGRNAVFNTRAFSWYDTANNWLNTGWTGADGTKPGPIDLAIKPGKSRTFNWTSNEIWAAVALFGHL